MFHKDFTPLCYCKIRLALSCGILADPVKLKIPSTYYYDKHSNKDMFVATVPQAS